MHTIVSENDESQWEDETGVRYRFPKRYEGYLISGTQIIYYKGMTWSSFSLQPS